jgi:hypothetical protein
MRVAYLNPWTNAAEGQAYFSLAAAGRAVGVDLVSCATAEDVERSGAEFVLSTASSVPKIADLPSYLTVHEPTKRFLGNAFYMNNLLSYDGYLTISDSLESFLRDVCIGTGRSDGIGFYYNTPQVSSLETNLAEIVSEERLRVVYIGTNWDRRAPGLLRRLDERGILRIHGPEASWSAHGYAGYAGPLPFDGEAPQEAYAAAGVGLVLLSADHLDEDVISNRIFEIASVGAVPVCPDMPWIRKWFGDTVLYFTRSRSSDRVAAEIVRHCAAIARDPGTAQERARQARGVFETHFAAERMLANAVRYHEEAQRSRAERLSRLPAEPRISVVVRCGGRDTEMVKTAVDSIRSQTYGRFTVIFATFKEFDLSPITNDASGRIERFVEVSSSGGNRAETLIAGLNEVDTEFFAILDDDDYWLSEHAETLFAAGRIADPDWDVVFAGSVCVSPDGKRIEKSLVWKRNIYSFGLARRLSNVTDVTAAFSSNCFVARSSLLPPDLGTLGLMETAEDSLVIAVVTRRKRPVFSYKATAFFRRGFEDESDFASHPSRQRDLLSLNRRAGMLLSPAWLNYSGTSPGGQGSSTTQWLREQRPVAVAFARYLIGDAVVLARLALAAAGHDHPSARADLLVSPLEALRRRR